MRMLRATISSFATSRTSPSYGYFGTVAWLIWDNASFRRAMASELEQRRLGPFRPIPEQERVAA